MTPAFNLRYLQALRARAVTSFLADVTGPDFQSPELRGCLRGRVGPGGGPAYNFPGNLLRWCEANQGELADRALVWLRDHVLHVARYETVGLVEDAPFFRVAGEYARTHPGLVLNQTLKTTTVDDSDPLRHWRVEGYVRLWREFGLFAGEPAEIVERLLRAWAADLMERTADLDRFVRVEVLREGAHSRVFFSAVNLAWLGHGLGEMELTERAAAIVTAAFNYSTMRKPAPSGLAGWAPVPCFCGGDREEFQGIGNPGAADRSVSPWHVGASALPIAQLWLLAPACRDELALYVRTQTDLAWGSPETDQVNTMLRGGQTDEFRLRGRRLEDPWSALEWTGRRYFPLCGLESWEYDDGYLEMYLPRAGDRVHYPRRRAEATPEKADVQSWFGWPDLLLCRYLLDGGELWRGRWLWSLRDYVYWRNRGGPGSFVIPTGSPPVDGGDPYRWANEGNNRGFAWWWEAGALSEQVLAAVPTLAELGRPGTEVERAAWVVLGMGP